MTKRLNALKLPVLGLLLAGSVGLSGCIKFDEPPANIDVDLVAYNQTLPQSFFDQSMAIIRMQYPQAEFKAASPNSTYGDLTYAYIEYYPEPESEYIHLHSLITDRIYAWRIDEKFMRKDRLKYRTKFNSILENIQRSRSPEYRRGRY